MSQHISFSALKNWNQCPYYYKLTYVDKIKGFVGNHYTAFGTALHEVCETKAENPEFDDEQNLFETAFLRELKSLPEDVRKDIKLKDVEQMREQGKKLSIIAVPALTSHFGEFEVVSTEEDLYESIENFEDYNFKGFIDLVIKTPDDKYHVIDWKTCSWGWDAKRRSDAITTYQLTLYKHFLSKKMEIDPKSIETHFALLKRTAKKNRVEFFRVTSGPRKTENALNMLNKALYNINNKRYIKNRLSCNRCNFRHTEHCP